MSYAHVHDDTPTPAPLPRTATKPDTGSTAHLRSTSREVREACGWYEIHDAPRPDDTAATTWDPGLTWDGTTVTRTWIERDKTADELAADTANTNRATITAATTTALATLQAHIDAPQITISNVAQAQTALRQLQSALQAQARILKRLIRYTFNELDSDT